MYIRTTWPSPLGQILLVCDDQALIHLSLPGQKPFDRPSREGEHPVLERTKDWLSRYFAGMAPDPGELPLRPEGSDFRRLIWELLLQIPYGETVSYGALVGEAARILGKPRMSAQAVGGAVGGQSHCDHHSLPPLPGG